MKLLGLFRTLIPLLLLVGLSQTQCPEMNSNQITNEQQVNSCEELVKSTKTSGHLSRFMNALLKLENVLIHLSGASRYILNIQNGIVLTTHVFKDSLQNWTFRVELEEALYPNDKLIFLPVSAKELLPDVLSGLVFGVTLIDYKKELVETRVNITVSTQPCLFQPQNTAECRFYNYSTRMLESHGCETKRQQDTCEVVCICDHLTFFALLMVPVNVSRADTIALTYISFTGCSVSLFFLLLAAIIYVCNRAVIVDVSFQVHINLVAALILLNGLLLPSHWVAELSTPGTCAYLAMVLHYTLLATFTWMFLEGVHIYMLLVRVFNIHIRRYLLKLCVVGWGVPALIVAIIAAVKNDVYQRVTVHASDDNTTYIHMCYLKDPIVKMVSNMTFFGLVFIFNVVMLLVTTMRIASVHRNRRPGEESGVKKVACNIIAVTCLLGTTWCLIFLCFEQLPTSGLYLFSIFNTLQGFFIFFWFCAVKVKATRSSSSTLSTSLQKS